MLFFFLSNLGDGKVQSCVDDESEEQEEKVEFSWLSEDEEIKDDFHNSR